MSQSEHESTGISDDQLPADVVPADDNPLAEGLPPGETEGDLLHDGKPTDPPEGEDRDTED
ncbi:MAG: hypothetical protein F2667_10715 [Actinobacteria bacterium]|uniref:Unannotated protein n=1 Tax=freshwater metagenome TaxID=449393 RepID=A0A6J6RIM0_9ZZZZ|nr:hypothetical protein [Actinomycetota bacterium]